MRQLHTMTTFERPDSLGLVLFKMSYCTMYDESSLMMMTMTMAVSDIIFCIKFHIVRAATHYYTMIMMMMMMMMLVMMMMTMAVSFV